MEFKGTKGKWKLENIDNNWLVMSNDENLVGINNNKANALLISKAPEMLEMLQIYLADLNNIIPPSDAQRNRIQDVEQLIKEASEI
jgi:hypothetical protein